MSRKSFTGQLFLDLSSEADLAKLQRHHRRVVRSKRDYMKQTRGLIIKDNLEIKWLQDKNEELSRILRAHQDCSHKQADVLQDLTVKLSHGDKLDEELEAEKCKVGLLKDQIAEWEKKLTEQSRGAVNHSWTFKNRHLLKIPPPLLENKLDMEHKCLNELMTKNEELREEVKTLQVERKLFLQVKSLLDKELHTIHRNISYLMNECAHTVDARAEIMEKQKMLTDKNAKKMTQYNREKINLEQTISHYSNAVAFLNIKDASRVSQNIDHRKVERKPKKNETKECELKDMNDVIKKILAETEEHNLDNLVRDFLQMGEKNYVLMTLNNSQDDKVETIRRHISQRHSEKDVLEAEQQQQLKKIQAQILNVSNKLKAADQQREVYEQQGTFIEKLLDQLKQDLKTLLEICYKSSELGSLDIQNENVTQYLVMIEERVELFTLHSHLHQYKKPSPWDMGTVSSIVNRLLGIKPQVFRSSTTAVKPVLCDDPDLSHDPDLVESELLEENEPLSKEVLLSHIRKRSRWRKKTN